MRVCKPSPFLARSAHGRGGIRMVSKAVRHLDITSCTCGTTTRPSPWPTSSILLPFSMLEAFTWPLDWSTQLFGTFVQHPRLSALDICDFVPPRHTHYGIMLPPGFSSLIDTVTGSLCSFGMSVRNGELPIVVCLD